MHNKTITSIFISCCLMLAITPAFAATFQINPKSDIVGEVRYVVAKKGDSLYTIGRAHDIGQLEMQEANPKINPDKSLKAGTQITVPAAFILPPGERVGLVINLAELRAYYFPANQPNTVMTFPLGIGREGWYTPIGETTVALKRDHPTWVPPPSIRAEAEAHGYELPDAIGPGPKNPLGNYAINFAWSGIRMHGTTSPQSIGLRASHGCIRMYPEDIDTLFHNIDIGTQVRVIYEPYKLGVQDGKLYLEAHELFPDNYYNIDHGTKFDRLQEVVKEYNYPNSEHINWLDAKEAIAGTTGYPVEIDKPAQVVPTQQPVGGDSQTKATEPAH